MIWKKRKISTVPKQELAERDVLEYLTYKLCFTNNFPMKPNHIQRYFKLSPADNFQYATVQTVDTQPENQSFKK